MDERSRHDTNGTSDALGPLAVLDELSEALTTPRDRVALRDVLERWIADRIGADTWRLLLRDEEALAAPALAGVVVARSRPLRTDDYAAECARHGLSLTAVDGSVPPHWLGAPLVVEQSVLGVLALGRHRRPFTAIDESLLASAARVVALALRGIDLTAAGASAERELGAAQEEIARVRGRAALGEVAAGVVHDFNNTLAAILIRAEILAAETEDAELRRHIDVIQSAALDGARGVRRIRDLAQPRHPRPFRPVDLNDVLDHAVAVARVRWRDEAQARDVTYDVKVEREPLPPVSGDPVELGDAFMMLVFGALAASPDGGRIVLRAGAAADRVYCSVTSGAPPASTADADDKVARASEIASRHGGEIVTSGDERDGWTTTLWLPASARAREPGAAAEMGAGGVRILLIDDESGVRESLREALTRLGHRVVACPDGDSGLDSLREESFDLVLTDLSMPGMSGWDVARQVKRDRPRMPVVLITGWGDEVDPEEAKATGIDAVLAKPLTARTLRAVVQAVMRPPRERYAEETG